MKWLALSLCLIISLSQQTFSASSRDWIVKKRWTPAYEKKFSDFISVMGQSKCRSLHQCLTNKESNPYYINKTPRDTKYLSDCADLPFALRAYFAWMENLPFDYVNKVVPDPKNGKDVKDIRYTKHGNKPYRHRKIVKGYRYDGPNEMRAIVNSVSTAMYRIHYKYVNDFYPIKITSEHIIPGTVLYDSSGHAGIIYAIEADGRIRMMDAHPDQSITRIVFGKKFTRSNPARGAGFKNWRPEGNMKATKRLNGFSDEIFGSYFEVNGRRLNYHDFVRARLSGGNLTFNPIVELKSMLEETCSNIADRVTAVQAAVNKKVNLKRHPNKLPANIYGTHGEWESYSSPSRDARLRAGIIEMKNDVERFLEMFADGSSRIKYKAVRTKTSRKYCSNSSAASCYLASSLKETYDKMAKSRACKFSYKKTNGRKRSFDLHHVMNNLFALSFDPYHCIEYRWGETGRELDSCRDNNNKRDWYEAQQGLRNQIERTYDKFMGLDLDGTYRNLGVDKAPETNVLETLGWYLN
jgi:hypothetical protein